MTSMKNTSLLKEQTSAEKNYLLNMEILSSLKSLPGKVVNLQSEKFIFKNDDINKKVFFPEEKCTTSSSISKELFCDPFSNEIDKTHKKSYSTNSVFKPISYFPIKKTTLNYFNLNSMMSFSDFLAPNPNPLPFNPLKVTNSSYSKNSFYRMNNTENNLINPINQISQINPINIINPANPFFQNYTQVPLITEPIIKKNDFIQTKSNFLLSKKRNSDTEINLNNNITKENKEKELENLKNNNNLLNNNMIRPKSTFFCIKQKEKQDSEEIKTKKNLFTTIQKSNYVYRKRKQRKKKFISIKDKLICSHEGCEGKFKTKKQLVYHHFKMNIECHKDTVNLLKMIYLTKKIILIKTGKKEKMLDKVAVLYKDAMKDISLNEHIETLVGFNFEDEIIN